MSIEQNKILVQKWVDRINSKDLEGALTHLGPNYVEHAVLPGMPSGAEAVRAFFSMLWAGFPDAQGTILDMIAEGDKVVVRMNGEGTHTGLFMGVPPTGKHVNFSWIDINRIADGKIVEHWNETDMLGIMQQLGLVPPPR